MIYSFFAPRLKDLGGQKNSAIDRRKWKNQNDRYLTTTRLPITPPLCRQPSCLLFSNPTFTRSAGLYLGNAGRGRRHESEFLTDAFPPLFSSLIHLLLFRGKAKASRAISILGPALYYLYSKKRGGLLTMTQPQNENFFAFKRTRPQKVSAQKNVSAYLSVNNVWFPSFQGRGVSARFWFFSPLQCGEAYRIRITLSPDFFLNARHRTKTSVTK